MLQAFLINLLGEGIYSALMISLVFALFFFFVGLYVKWMDT